MPGGRLKQLVACDLREASDANCPSANISGPFMVSIDTRTTHPARFVGGPSRTRFRRAGLAAITLALHLVSAQAALAQVDVASSDALRVFLDCGRCDQDFMRTEITFVDFVRDRHDAQVHVLVTMQATGGGTEYSMAFIGLEYFSPK